MTQTPHNAGGVPNGAAAQNQQQLANGVSSAAVATAQSIQFARVEKPYSKFYLELREPISFNGKSYQQLAFREVAMCDVSIVQEKGDGPEAMAEVFSNMSGAPAQVFLQMPTKELALLLGFFTECMSGLNAMV